MSQFDDIRRGLAAELRTVLAEDDGHVSAYFRTKPSMPALMVEGIERMTKTDFGDGRSYIVRIEGLFSLAAEIDGQKKLDALIDTVAAALEASNSPQGALFSRYQDDNTVLAAQPAAAGSVAFVEYRGGARVPIEGTAAQAISATWVCEVQT